MSNEAENQDGDETPTPYVPVWARDEACQLTERDWDILIEAASNPSEVLMRIRREAKKIEVRERKAEDAQATPESDVLRQGV